MREGMEANRDEAKAIRDELELQNSKLDFHTKMQSLAFAIQSVEAKYLNRHGGAGNYNTIMVIMSRSAAGIWYVDHAAGDERLKSEQASRNKLSSQIH